ncbi:hypothetical protein MA20_34920 [Bradyrhizobium japonicum]|uniref:Uncharacterized protein n=1 Tax=Bradyrhizobium japonicum TaxID=375 RepID=A0A0A3XLI7_BRAJP|nr:hypothetical protein [Bradyrhizobium japonicum]KGT75235.1 hypothetical protein MA20_34920 [Bradyrhizobium japonicum]
MADTFKVESCASAGSVPIYKSRDDGTLDQQIDGRRDLSIDAGGFSTDLGNGRLQSFFVLASGAPNWMLRIRKFGRAFDEGASVKVRSFEPFGERIEIRRDRTSGAPAERLGAFAKSSHPA